MSALVKASLVKMTTKSTNAKKPSLLNSHNDIVKIYVQKCTLNIWLSWLFLAQLPINSFMKQLRLLSSFKPLNESL